MKRLTGRFGIFVNEVGETLDAARSDIQALLMRPMVKHFLVEDSGFYKRICFSSHNKRRGRC